MKWLVVAGLAATSCLPRGPAPAGSKVVATRETTAFADFLPATPDRSRPMLVWQTRSDGIGADLFITTWSASAGPGPLRPLAERIMPRSCGSPDGCRDARGRLLVQRAQTRDPQGQIQDLTLLWLDPVTGATEELGAFFTYQLSPAGGRIVGRKANLGEIVVLDAGGQATTLDGVIRFDLVGEDVFYLTAPPQTDPTQPSVPGRLSVLRADGTTVAIGKPAATYDVRTVGGAPKLLVQRPWAAAPMASIQTNQMWLLDPATLDEKVIPGSERFYDVALSPDGRRAVGADYIVSFDDPSRTLTFVDLQTGEMDAVTIAMSIYAPSQVPVYWRPNHDEAWIPTSDRVVVWRPGVPRTEIQGVFLDYVSHDGSDPRFFTRDGARVFVWGLDPSTMNTAFTPVYLASADDPTGPRLRLNPPGTGLSQVDDLPDGKFLIRTWTTLPERGDTQIVDPVQGTIRQVATGGLLEGMGSGRALALLHLVDRAGEGDLTLIDLASGMQTSLAQNVLAFDLSSDPIGALAPGTPVGFFVRSSLPSPYDGLWVAPLP
jgi:hypothetical protein